MGTGPLHGWGGGGWVGVGRGILIGGAGGVTCFTTVHMLTRIALIDAWSKVVATCCVPCIV